MDSQQYSQHVETKTRHAVYIQAQGPSSAETNLLSGRPAWLPTLQQDKNNHECAGKRHVSMACNSPTASAMQALTLADQSVALKGRADEVWAAAWQRQGVA